MKKYFLGIAILCATIFYWGFSVGKYRAFPYEILQTINWKIKGPVRATGEEVTQFDFFKPKVDVVFVGDSITAGGVWNDIFPNVKIANRGIVGETIQEIELRLDEIIDLKPKAVFLMAGINDLYRATSPDEVFSSFKRVVSTFTKSGIKVYLQGTLQCSVKICGKSKIEKISEINSNLRKLADESNGVVFIDINSNLSDADGLMTAFTPDGIHLKPEGYVVWRDTIEPFISPYATIK